MSQSLGVTDTAGWTADRGAATALSMPAALALAVASGLAYAAGFPPWSLPLAPWLALAPLLVATAALPPRRAALLGVCWAATVAAASAWFLPGMLASYFRLAPAVSWLATLAVVGGLHGVSLAVYTGWVAWLVRRRAADPLLIAGGWLAVELARGASGVSSPWALAAYSQIAWTPLIQIADLAGPYGIGLLIAAMNAILAAALVPALRGRRPRRSAGAILAALFAAGFYGQWRLAQPFADGEPLAVAIIQGGAPAPSLAQRGPQLARYLALSRGAGDLAGGLILWPEHAIADYLEEDSPTRAAVLALSRERGADVVLGGPRFAPAPSGTRYYNSAWLLRGGRIAGRYDKHRLVPVAEDGLLAGLLGPAGAAYSAGTGSFVLASPRHRLGVLLCFEAMFGDLARRAVDEGAEVLVNLSNDGWFAHADPARHQFDIAALRAVETRRYLLRAAATGVSAVVDPYGRTVVASAFGTHEVLRATVRAAHGRTFYQRWGDLPAWAVAAVVLLTSLRRGTGRGVRVRRAGPQPLPTRPARRLV